MRPVNLIPLDERRGDRAPSRTGNLPYVLVAGLAVAVVAVAALVLTGNQVKDREAEVASLEAQEASAQQRAAALQPYADFAQMAVARDQTVNSLATSRFDWERVLRELARVMPADVWLSEMSGTVGPNVALENVVEVGQRASVPGPALALVGCGVDQEAVAEFVAALEDIDGVTRVGLAASERNQPDQQGGTGGTDCRTRDFIARFEIVVAFDSAPLSAAAAATSGVVPVAPAVPAATTTDPAATVSDPATADATAEQQGAKDSTGEQVGKARDAAGLPGQVTP